MRVDDLPGWRNAAAIVLSCPGPLRRHSAALMPMAEAALPQVLLGGESQLAAFAASAKSLADRLFFAPFPEMFPDAPSLRAAWRRAGGRAPDGGRLAHLRFGSVRAARILKGVRNGCVVAEFAGALPLTASHHPFASGAILPAAMQRLFVYGPDCQRPRTLGGGAIPSSRLSADCVTADLLGHEAGLEPSGTETGLELVSLAEFRSFAWAAGPVRGRGARAELSAGRPAVLLPWNMDHPGSIVPSLLERLARLHAPARGSAATPAMPRIVLMPFNYVGQTGIIRRLIGRLREAAHDPEALLGELFLARVASLEGVSSLRRIARVAWVDGNDPEHWWTLARFAACRIATILIDPADDSVRDRGLRLQADEAVWVEAETRCGTLTFPSRLPSLRALPGLLALTASLVSEAAPRRKRALKMALRGAAASAP
jgi:hypothetical protein